LSLIVSEKLRSRIWPIGRIGRGDWNGRLEAEAPLRAELFTVEQLERHARNIAGQQRVAPPGGSDKLIPRLRQNEQVLFEAYELILEATKKGLKIDPAPEWLLDNFILIEQQIRTARRHFPKKYSGELLQLETGPHVGLPRVYELAYELILHVDGRVDAQNLSSFVSAYQGIQSLRIGELWAIPIMLRLALLENLRRIAISIIRNRRDKDLAILWAERMLKVAEAKPQKLVVVLGDMAREDPNLSGAFVSEFARQLQGKHPALTFVLTWIDQRLAEQSQSIERMVHAETQALAADQVSMGNSIASLRLLGALDWRDFVEAHSIVERELSKDPASVYASMDFFSRDRYRHVVEKLSRRCRFTEYSVAQKAVELAKHSAASDGAQTSGYNPASHVGYYLIDAGRPALEQAIGVRLSLWQSLIRLLRQFVLLWYVGAILAITAVASALLIHSAHEFGLHGWWLRIYAVLGVLCASQLGVAIVNWLTTVVVPPRRLPRLDYSKGVPANHRAMVVIPTLLSSHAGTEDLLEGLEVRYLANRDDNLFFALLTDFKDAHEETGPEDEALVKQARQGIEALNRKYAADRPGIFFLLHRPRRWNPRERLWMGYERKRGKLAEFNALLRGGDQGRFAAVVGDPSVFSSIHYVITLDTDTQLPRDTARQLVGAMVHPLNRPVYDADKGRITKGYAVLQPRVSVSLASAGRSLFSRLFSGDAGIDPYTRTVSDAYQDVFDEGSFIGKGIYDVDAFDKAVGGRLPENSILSHDLLEGVHARCGLLSDVELIEEYPSHFVADTARRHRWIRGDWQILPWLLPAVPAIDARSVRNPISWLSRWKILDNLRRSLVPPAMVAILLFGWLLTLTAIARITTAFALIVLTLAYLLPAFLELIRKPHQMPIRLHLHTVLAPMGRNLGQLVFTIFFLPYEAYYCLDAIVRTLFRMLVTRRRLLEWTTASDSERAAQHRLLPFLASMWAGPVLAIATGVALWFRTPHHLAFAGPLLLSWLISPAAAWWLSRPLRLRAVHLSSEQHTFLHKIARRTWRYFETFVGPQDNWLPPDNYQEEPAEVLAHRTSPTNIGLSLIANLAACDFGYISCAQMVDRTAKALSVLDRLPRYQGHLFNWYDTQSLQPLPPQYVSTVDSGNLVGHLLVLRQGLLEQMSAAICPPIVLEGIKSTALIALDCAESDKNDIAEKLQQIVKRLDAAGATAHPDQKESGAVRSRTLQTVFTEASAITEALRDNSDPELRWWTQAIARACRDHLDDLDAVAPWLIWSVPAEEQWHAGSAQRVHALSKLRQAILQIEQATDLSNIAGQVDLLLPLIDAASDGQSAPGDWLSELRQRIAASGQNASRRLADLERLAEQCRQFADVDWKFLYDRSRNLLSIGFNLADHRLDNSVYDLLGGEARLASFLGIAFGQLPQEHWFALGRTLTTTGVKPALISWSGSMFEYLMPLLVMPTYRNTLLDQTYNAVVARQIQYGRQRGVPWGISESGYNATDAHLVYQYRAFGVPGLGLKPGLSEDLVIAPYATVLALMVAPEPATENLERLAQDGRLGRYGYYEAIDYTPTRLPPGQEEAVIRSFMSHHLGMSLLALEYLLLSQPMQRRFDADPTLRATDLLLQERVPKGIVPMFPHRAEAAAVRPEAAEMESMMRVFKTPNTPTPEVHLLSNGRYHVMVTAAGGGYSRWRDLAVTRWREDPTCDSWGSFCYLRDVESNQYWSTTFQPTLRSSSSYEAIFTQARAEFRRQDQDIELHTEISVSPEDDIELRRITIRNHSSRARVIEITTYAEVVLTQPAAEAAHPAFANLFVQTQIVRDRQAILCTRRPRSLEESTYWMLHLMTVQGTPVGEISYETDRVNFIGRGRNLANPAAMMQRTGGALSDSEGSPLDPIVALRRRIRIEPQDVARVDVVTGVAETRAAALALVDKYHDHSLADRVFEMAHTHSQMVLRQLNASEAAAQVFGRLAGSVLYADPSKRAAAALLSRNRRGQSALWGYGISGDLPIVLVRVGDLNRLELVRQAVQAHAYWRNKGVSVDLVIWNEDESLYRQSLHDQIMGLIAGGPEAGMFDKPGGIFVRHGAQIPEEDRNLLLTVARLVITDADRSLEEVADRRPRPEVTPPRFVPLRWRSQPAAAPARLPQHDLIFFNGFGGFTRDGREYVMVLQPGQNTPAPWVNILANPDFGTLVSESGSSYTWAENCHEYRLTPWNNDPVVNPSGEALYIRDEESGQFYSPTPHPVPGQSPYVVRHGFGYSIFEHEEGGIATELAMYVAIDAPVKILLVKFRNTSRRRRRLSLFGYWELVLGELRSKTQLHVVTEIDSQTGAIFARNPYNVDFADRVAFVDAGESVRRVTADRTEFLGRNGTTSSPAALGRIRLSGRTGAGLDPCAAIQLPFDLDEGEEKHIVLVIGAAPNNHRARELALRFRTVGEAHAALNAVWDHWKGPLGVVRVETPDPAIDVLVNGWLLYQVISCRLWGRSGFYQSGGAIGFRDQLQDTMALLHAEPPLLRQQLLVAAGRQFREGDVQHWWHPPVGRGVRTRISDDYLWLPYATCRYVLGTGDTGVLDERIPFLEARALRPEEDAVYELPQHSAETGTLYEHCVRAIEHGLRFGSHGLPLMGSGDWNDGMNLVGIHGQGESVWLAFFLYDVLQQFAVIAKGRNDPSMVARCQDQALKLQSAIEEHAWDGQWYLRAFFDNGQPLGSASNPECQIDALPQSWAVISGAGDPGRSRTAMTSAARLVRPEARLIQLFDPPFDKSPLDPGYIKGYVPGVRENGGQYTHAAVWMVMACALGGDADRAWQWLSFILPISHGGDPTSIQTYKVEPYVSAADVYGFAPHTGRGGWTWYTGSAGWMYRLIVETLLGLNLEVDHLRLRPRIPSGWKSYKIHYRYRQTLYHITINNQGDPAGMMEIIVDKQPRSDGIVPLTDDHQEHQVEVRVGLSAPRPTVMAPAKTGIS
jgi:cyclic beta-1,2-glucan synthetase